MNFIIHFPTEKLNFLCLHDVQSQSMFICLHILETYISDRYSFQWPDNPWPKYIPERRSDCRGNVTPNVSVLPIKAFIKSVMRDTNIT